MADPKDKAALREFAAYWTRMAEQAERNERGQTQEAATTPAQQHYPDGTEK
jgi:hypothetical protein